MTFPGGGLLMVKQEKLQGWINKRRIERFGKCRASHLQKPGAGCGGAVWNPSTHMVDEPVLQSDTLSSLKELKHSQVWWLTDVMTALWVEAEAGRFL